MKLHQTEIKQKRKYTSVLLLPTLKILLHSVFVFSHICAVTNTQLFPLWAFSLKYVILKFIVFCLNFSNQG